MSHSVRELQDKGIAELRKMIRDEAPVLRGATSAMITKQECIDVLSGAADAEAMKQRIYTRMQGGAVAPPAEGEDGSHASTPNEGVHPIPDDPTEMEPEQITPEWVMNHQGIRSHAVATAIAEGLRRAAEVAKAEREAEAKRKAEEQAEARKAALTAALGSNRLMPNTTETVTICGIDCPVVGHTEYVPELDDKYVPEVWRATTKAGTLAFQQDVSDLLRLLLAGWTAYLNGPRGCGKTTALEYICAQMKWGLVRVQGNKDMSVDDFCGTMQAANGATFFVPGPLMIAMERGYILLVDEVDRFPPDCTDILHSVMERNATGKLVVTANNGQVITPHPNFRIVGTANTAGFGDDSGLHPNSRVQDAAFIDRFSALLNVAYPSKADENRLLAFKLGLSNRRPKGKMHGLQPSGIDKNTIKMMTSVAADTRKAAENQQMLYPLSTRQLLNWAAAAQIVPFSTAFCLTVLNKVPPSDQSVVIEIAQRHMGNDLGGVVVTDTDTDTDEDSDD